MILHCLNCDAYAPALDDMLAWASGDDTILLLGEACNLARLGHPRLPLLKRSGARLYALDDDLIRHGVEETDEAIEAADFSTWVALAVSTTRQMCWR